MPKTQTHSLLMLVEIAVTDPEGSAAEELDLSAVEEELESVTKERAALATEAAGFAAAEDDVTVTFLDPNVRLRPSAE